MISERGLKTKPRRWVDFKFIANRNWQALTSIPILIVVPLVREFFSNVAFSKDNYLVFIREKNVSFSAKTINEHYSLTPLDDDEDEFSFYINREQIMMILLKGYVCSGRHGYPVNMKN